MCIGRAFHRQSLRPTCALRLQAAADCVAWVDSASPDEILLATYSQLGADLRVWNVASQLQVGAAVGLRLTGPAMVQDMKNDGFVLFPSDTR